MNTKTAIYSKYSQPVKKLKIVPANERISMPIISKYEMTTVIGARAEQLKNGVTPNVEIPDEIAGNWIKIAELELISHAIPFAIRRDVMHDGEWKHEIFNLYDDPNDEKVRCELTIIHRDV